MNYFNLIVPLSTPSLRQGQGFFLASLSVVDLGIGLVSALTISPAATFQATEEAWPHGDAGCLLRRHGNLAPALLLRVQTDSDANQHRRLHCRGFPTEAHPSRVVIGWLTIGAVFTWAVLGTQASRTSPRFISAN